MPGEAGAANGTMISSQIGGCYADISGHVSMILKRPGSPIPLNARPSIKECALNDIGIPNMI